MATNICIHQHTMGKGTNDLLLAIELNWYMYVNTLTITRIGRDLATDKLFTNIHIYICMCKLHGCKHPVLCFEL